MMPLDEPQIPAKLQELLDETGTNGQLEMHVVLHLLAATYLENRHMEFARYCSEFSTLKIQTTADIQLG